ncbi:MAG: TraB/GumN family protein [Pseudomonadota bacterium]
MERRFPLWLALTALLALSACDWGKPEAEDDWPDPNPLIFEIANQQGEVEGWLLGTVHALPDGVEWRTAAIEAVVNDADLLYVEVAELNDRTRIAGTFTSLATTPDMGSLKLRIDPELHCTLEDMLNSSSYSPSDFANVEDWAAAIMLARVGAPGNPDNGVDKVLIEDFDSREVRGFESASEQLGIFDQLAAADQQDLLEGTLLEWSASRKDPSALTRAWLAGDEVTLSDVTTTGIMADPELRAALLTDRNEAWIDPLVDTLAQSPRPLVAVGAAHVIGPDGLAAMLEARGFSVRRLE